MKDLAKASSVTAKDRYRKLETERNSFLDRARECAVLTIPSILPPSGFSSSSKLPTPYQSLGARGVRVLASKLMLALFPQIPFFNYRVEDSILRDLGAKRGEIEAALASRERAVVAEVDHAVFRPVVFMCMQHLLVTGNALLNLPASPDERAKMYRLDQYVVRRDAAGNLLEIVIREEIDQTVLPPEILGVILSNKQSGDRSGNTDGMTMEPTPVELYTHIYLTKDNKWETYQEVEGIILPGTVGKYKKDELPYLALRFNNQPGESYGRSYAEEYLGDLDSLEALSEALVDGSAAAAKIVFLVDPAGTTQLKVIQEARSGDIRAGRADDVSVMQLQKSQDLSIAKQQAEEIATRLSYAFMLHASVQRAGERVTAEEIRYLAADLDDGLGGVYTLFAADLQLPIVRLFERRMEKRLGAKALDSKTVKPQVVAGLEAIGRGHDQRNLSTFVKEIIGMVGPELALRYLNPREFMSRAAAAYNIDTEGLIPSEEEVAQAEQQAQIQQIIAQLGPNAINQLGGSANTMLKASLPPPPKAPQ